MASEELKDIKKLLILLLYKVGAGQGEIAKALGLKSQSSLSEMLPIREITPAEVRLLSKEKRNLRCVK